jgi:hypothetical protein
MARPWTRKHPSILQPAARNLHFARRIIGEEKTLLIKFGKEAGGDALDAVVIRGQSTDVDRAVQKIHEIVEDAKNELIASSYVCCVRMTLVTFPDSQSVHGIRHRP